jgi:hypothetical protein
VIDGPVVTAARLGPGHDGRAEVVVDLAYPNGGRTQLSIAQEAVTRALDAAGLTSLDELAGRSWTVLVAGMPAIGLDAT